MKRIIKWVATGLAGLLLLVIITGLVLPLIYDTEDLKREVSRRVTEQTGRELEIAGDLGFQVFPWLAIEVNELSLGNAPGFGAEIIDVFPETEWEAGSMEPVLVPPGYALNQASAGGNTTVTLATDIDPAYAAAFEMAQAQGVERLVYGTRISPEGVWVDASNGFQMP